MVEPFPPRKASPEETLMILPATVVNTVLVGQPLCLNMSLEIV